ncbi:MAG: protein translocase SEC61 complex subunit gamma [Candidatus Bilamarchaeaceae archaeon]
MDLNELIKRCVRILHISRKPTQSEYDEVAKVAALGMAAFGTVGLIVSVLLGALDKVIA